TAEAAGIAFYVATTPPLGSCGESGCTSIRATNDLLRASFAGRFRESFDGFTSEHFHPDRLHLNDAGPGLRAERAFDLLAIPVAGDGS
ncbi:MAG: hypothetical protein AB1689_07330, partial [Thermodesulfobacteriota bacterium]